MTITLLGAVSGTGQLPWQAGRSVTDYLQDHPRLAGADKNNVMVITPEGETAVALLPCGIKDMWNHRLAASFGWAFLRMYCPKNMLI